MRNLTPALLLALFCFPTAANASDPVTLESETWDRMHIAGAHAGYVHKTVQRVDGDSGTRIETHDVQEMKIKRLGNTIEIKARSVAWEKPDGTLLRLESVVKQSAQEMKSIYTFDDGKMTVETTVMGNQRKVEVDVDKDVVGPAYIERAKAKLQGTNGESVTFKQFLSDFQKVVTTTVTSKGMETVELRGGAKAELTRVETVMEGVPMLKPKEWLDAQGAVLKGATTMSGILFEVYRVKDKAAATAKDATTEPRPDVFAQTLVTENDPIPVPRRIEKAWITIKLRKPDAELPKVDAEGYMVTKVAKDMIVVIGERAVPAAGKQGTRPLAEVPEALKDAMAPSSMIQSDAEEIVKIANEVVGDETNAWKAAQKLERWVFENMTSKNMNVAMASALEACKTREGDCTEHAVLLAALCRAAGIPARVVMGVEYLMGIWGGHAWSDVWIDGKWYQLDGTIGYGYVDPLHLPFGQMTMKEGGGAEFLEVIGSIGNLDIDITKVTRDGREIDVNASPDVVKVEDGRYTNPILSLAFDAPEGFELAPRRPKAGMSALVAEFRGKTESGSRNVIRVDSFGVNPSTMEAALKELKWKDGESGTIDGRPSHSRTQTRGNRSVMQTCVVDNGAVFLFTLGRSDEEAHRKAFEKLLQSVDLDVK